MNRDYCQNAWRCGLFLYRFPDRVNGRVLESALLYGAWIHPKNALAFSGNLSDGALFRAALKDMQ
jgi:hypothetical protein